METFQDVIVIGGGPCGSFSALNLAKNGVNVTVFEEHREIGAPSHCAGHLSINGLKRLALYPLPKEVVENIFYGANFHSPNGAKFSVRFDSPITCAVNRTLFDKYIACLAKDSGAHYQLNSQVKSLIIDKAHVKGANIQQDEKTFEVSAKIVVDAEGISSRILRQAGLHPPRSDMIVHGFQAEVENVKNIEPDFVEVFLGSAYAPGFYAWLIPKHDGKAKVGLAARKGNPKELLKNLMHKHPAASLKLQKAKILRESLHPITLGGPIPKAYSNGFLAVGDAASQVKPTTGGGVILGLNCAKIAAEVALEALDKGDFSSKLLSAYQKRCMEILGFDIKAMLMIRRMLDKISDKKLDGIIGFYRKIHLEKAVKNFKEIDFQGQALIKAGKDPRILAALTYFFASYLSASS
ncbi:MAG: geranylgeranyl reductase family protein [Candidatus Bathyarchaeales archaeon]